MKIRLFDNTDTGDSSVSNLILRIAEPPHQTSKSETDKVDLKDLNATAKSKKRRKLL